MAHNDKGQIGDDGVLRDHLGNVVPVGPDEATKAALQEVIDGPKIREVPSERDRFFAAGGSLEARPVTYEDSQPSGGVEDLKAQEKKAPEVKSTDVTAKDKK